MIDIYKTIEDKLEPVTNIDKGCWLHLTAPTPDEVAKVTEELGIEPGFVAAALDEEESARLEYEDGQLLIIVDIPIVELEGETYVYSTLPMGIVLTSENIVTVCLKESPMIQDFTEGRVRGFWTYKRTRFVLQLLYRNAIRYLMYLRHIDKQSLRVENEMYKSMRNKELIQMLKIEKSLVYFSTSLKSNEVVLEKLMRQEMVKRYPDDEDLLEDVIVENKQAIEMCNIYRDILSGTMDAFASLISNNLNIVMKVLTSITLVISIPTLFASLWGMNVKGMPFADNPTGFWIIAGISLICSIAAACVLYRKKMF